MKYQILGGGPLEATTDLGLVQALRLDAQDWAPSVGIEDFMEAMAERCFSYRGVVVRTDRVAHFIADLKQHEFLTPIL